MKPETDKQGTDKQGTEPAQPPDAGTSTLEQLQAELKNHQKLLDDAWKREKAEKEKRLKLEQDRKDAEEAKRKGDLEAEGNYKQALKEATDKHEAELSRLQNEILKRDLRDKLRSEVKNPFELDIFLDWAVDRFQGTPEDIPEYIQGLKESDTTASRFKEPEIPPAQGHQAHAAASVRGAGAASLKDRLNSSDPKVKLDALNEQFALQVDGKLPVS